MQEERYPVLILSDSPLGPSGLGRIAREIAERAVHIPEIEIGFAGLGGTTSKHLPYPFYPLTRLPNYSLPDLPQVWRDFAGDRKGAIFTIWNHTWLHWLTEPKANPPGELRDFVAQKPFDLWGYIPVDATRADGTLPRGDILARFDRLLAYTAFGQEAIGRTTQRPVPHMPHGLDTSIFFPRDPQTSRKSFGLPEVSGPLIGVVATNSERKDWGLAFEVAAEIPDCLLWAHTDRTHGPEAFWNLPELAQINGVKNVIITTCHYLDHRMAEMYSACDCTLGIGNEGWGLPLSESLACGTPVVTMDWAGQTEFVPQSMRVRPQGYLQFGYAGLVRPIHEHWHWVANLKAAKKSEMSLLDPQFEWRNCWPRWEAWLKEGIQ